VKHWPPDLAQKLPADRTHPPPTEAHVLSAQCVAACVEDCRVESADRYGESTGTDDGTRMCRRATTATAAAKRRTILIGRCMVIPPAGPGTCPAAGRERVGEGGVAAGETSR